MAPPGPGARVQRAPPSLVSHSPVPNTKPSAGMANRMPHTAGAALIPNRPAGTARTAAVRQVTPRSKVRAIDVQGACEQGEVPSTNASRADTNVKDIAANPYGTRAPGTGESGDHNRDQRRRLYWHHLPPASYHN